MSSPQAVTERYVSNLLHYGRNKEFDIATISRDVTIVDETCVGVYFNVLLTKQNASGELPHQRASGATIAQALRRALEKHGVTFR